MPVRARLAAAAWLALPVVLSAALWFPVTRNYFFGDDLRTLYDIVNEPLGELLLVPYGGHLYIVRNAVYALVYALWGATPAPGYFAELATHLANVALLAVAVGRLTGSPPLACFGAVLWGTAPVIEGTIGWYSVWGHALATLAFLVVLVRVLRAGGNGRVGRAELVGWAVVVVAGSTCFGAGLGFALVLPVLAWLLVPPGPVRRRAVPTLAVAAAASVVVYVVAVRLAHRLYGSPVDAAGLTTALGRWRPILDVVSGMATFGLGEVALGPFAASVADIAWIPGAALLVVGLALTLRDHPARWRPVAAFALLALVSYGIIAAGRGGLFPAWRSLLIHSQRYHYATTLALAVLLCLALQGLGDAFRIAPRAGRVLLVAWLVVWGAGLARVRAAIDHHDVPRAVAMRADATLRRLVERAPPGDVYVLNRPFTGVGPFVLWSPTLFPRLAAFFVVHHPDGMLDGRRVLFVEADPAVRARAARGRRSRSVIVAPDAVPPGRRPLDPAPPA